MFRLLLIALALMCARLTFAQQAWLVQFTDKAGVQFSPESYFSPKALERRSLQGLPLCDSSDFPVQNAYVEQVAPFADSLLHTSRWLNGVGVLTDAARVQQIEQLACVRRVVPLHGQMQPATSRIPKEDLDALDRRDSLLLYWQTRRMQADSLWERGLDGSGVRVCILDVGFKAANESPYLKQLFENEQIIDTRNFVRKGKDVWRAHEHGTMVLSCIAGQYDDRWMGLAGKAEFLLGVTDGVLFEPLGDELNWVAGLEWADRNGADIVNSSLGYTFQRYFPEDMTGKKSVVAQACQFAARKGMLVVNAAGNEGTGEWKRLATPGDADSALTVGGINPWTDIAEEFTSVGPSADGRVKPEVVAYGTALVAGKNGITWASGTSFAAPLISGFMACMKQHQPDLGPVEMIRVVSECGHLWPYYDYIHGYGVPHASRLFIDRERYKPAETFELDFSQEETSPTISENAEGRFKVMIDPEQPLKVVLLPKLEHPELKTYIHYHIAQPNGRLAYYAVLESDRETQEQILFEDNKYAEPGTRLRV
ncbi:MAG: S8 family serine peptidase, partial [Bacteroidota bacterium]